MECVSGGVRKRHPARFSGLDADEASGAIFAIANPWSNAGDHVLRLWAYAGAGRWTPGPELEAKKGVVLDDVDARFTFVLDCRRIVAASGDDRFYEAEAGAWLDSIPKRESGTPSKIAATAPAKPRKRDMFVIATTKKPGVDRIGGPAPVAAPKCSSCRAPMKFLAMFQADAERLPLAEPAKALALFCG